jgi:hypothetical protein
MPSPSNTGLVVDVALRPHELVAAWRPDSRRVLLPLRDPVVRNQRVQARIGLTGLRAGATITGRVVSVLRQPGVYLVELAPDDTRVEALQHLVAVASGAPVDYSQARAPRLLAEVPAVVYGLQGPTYMKTFAVSRGGCGLAWSGPVPAVGTPMEIRLGAGRDVAKFCAEVRWAAAPRGRSPAVGVLFAAGERDAWARMLDGLKRAGAPPA